MAIIEVNVVSGYLPMKDDLKKVVWSSNKAIRKFDVDGNKISFYVDKLTVRDVCVELRLVREVDVEEVKPGTVVVYDYYEPDFQISEVSSGCFTNFHYNDYSLTTINLSLVTTIVSLFPIVIAK